MRKLLAVICAIALILSVSAPAFASSVPTTEPEQEDTDWGDENDDDWPEEDDDDDWPEEDDDDDWPEEDDDDDDWPEEDDDDDDWPEEDDDDDVEPVKPGKTSPTVWWTTDDDDDDGHHHKKSSKTSTDSGSTDGDKGTVPTTSIWVPTMDIAGHDSMLAKPLEVLQAGSQRIQIPALMNRTSLDGLILVLTQTDGTVLYAKLADFGDTFDSANGAITIDFPAAGTCELLAPVA